MRAPGWWWIGSAHEEPYTARELAGRRWEVRRWSKFWGRDMRVGTAATEEEARALADKKGGAARDTSNGRLYMSKRYKRITGFGQGGVGPFQTVPQRSSGGRPEWTGRGTVEDSGEGDMDEYLRDW